MRRPLTATDDDLSRLAVSPVDNIAFSTAQNSSSSSTTTGNSPGDLQTEEDLGVAYLPKIIELEWQQQTQQQQNQNHRKRKERLDSTSSNSQTDRKVVRSNNNESSDQQPDKESDSSPTSSEGDSKVPELVVAEDKSLIRPHSSPVNNHHPHVLQHNLSSVSHHQYQQQQQQQAGKKTLGSNGSAGTNLSHAAWNNNVVSTGDDHYSDGEHERRRSSERFCRTRAPHGRKSSSCSSAKKSSSSSAGGGGTRYLSKAAILRHAEKAEAAAAAAAADQQCYKYDLTVMKTERRGFISRDSQKQKKQKGEDSATEGVETLHQMEVAEEQTAAPLPWNEFPDEQPVVCPRFAENTFDHVINVSDKFSKMNPPKKESNSIKYVNNENMKTRDIMKKYGSQGGALTGNNNNNNNNTWSKNRNVGDLRLMIITPEERMRQISGRMTKLKKRISLYEESFERDFGYKPDKVDTMNDKAMKTIMTEIQKLKRERQVLKTCDLGSVTGGSAGITGNGGLVTPLTGAPVSQMFGGLKEVTQDTQLLSGDMKISKMQETVTDIETVLQERRKDDSRLESLDKLSLDQLLLEKTAVQKGLLYFEGMYGRPNTKEERDLARPLYDRYRQIKRMLNRNSSLVSNTADLPTIHEHEAMVFTTSSTNNTPSTDNTSPEEQSAATQRTTFGRKGKGEDTEQEEEVIVTDDSSSLNDNLHQLSITELWHQLDIVREEKKALRRTIKEFEGKFELDAGRKMLKGDRKQMEDTYALYKQKKGRLRLLDALVKKHMAY